MKKYIQILVAVVFYNTATSQVLYSESFDNLTLGNLGTDPTGVVPGQGGWLTTMHQNANSSHVIITTEPNRGKVLTATSGMPPEQHNIVIFKNGLNTLIDQRTYGNDVIKLEVDFYTGTQHSFNNPGMHHSFGLSEHSTNLVRYSYNPAYGGISGQYKDQLKYVSLKKNGSINDPSFLPYNSWITFVVYLDYTNRKIYFETPYFNNVAVGDFLKNSTSANLIEDFKPTSFVYGFSSSGLTSTNEMVNKLDNIKITALNAVPPHILSAKSVLAQNFNLYPNPATNMVHITNTENMLVNQIEVYDTTGKLITTESYNNETEIQLNVEHLASGTYMLHLQTNEGTAVKKLVKK